VNPESLAGVRPTSSESFAASKPSRFFLVSLDLERVRFVARRGSFDGTPCALYCTGAAWPRRAAPPCRHACPRGCAGHPLADPRAPSGAPRCGEHVGAHPVAGDLTADEIRSSEVLSLSVTLNSGVGDPLSAAGDRGG